MSDPQSALFAALARATAKATRVLKDSKNSYHNYRYASAEAIIAESREALASEGICVLTSWSVIPRDAPESNGSRTAIYFADVDVTYLVAHESGGHLQLTSRTPAIVEKGRPEDKAVATALTYSLGYFLRGLLLLPRSDEEHDVDRRDDRNYEPARRTTESDRKPDIHGIAMPDVRRPDRMPDIPVVRRPGVDTPNVSQFDMDGAIVAIRESETVDDLRKVGGTFGDATLAQKAQLATEYRDRMAFLRSTSPPTSPPTGTGS